MSWWLLQTFGVVGVLAFLPAFIWVTVKLIRRNRVESSWFILLALSLVAAWPLGWLFHIGQIEYPANVDAVEPRVYIRLPVDQPVLVGWGGDKLKTNYHAIAPNERWAYDLIMPPASVHSPNLEDYGIYGVDVVAPASGTVTAAHDGEADLTPGTDHYESMAGNSIVIRLDETGTYLFIAHLKKGSVLVKEGQHVDEGTLIAEAGNSGNSSEPHIHIHHQRQDPSKTSVFLSEGLPLFFRDIEGSPMPEGGIETIDGIERPVGETISPLHR